MPQSRIQSTLPVLLLAAGWLGGCGTATQQPGDNPPQQPGPMMGMAGSPSPQPGQPNQPTPGHNADPGIPVPNIPATGDELRFDALRDESEAASELDAAGALAKYPVQFRPALSYQPGSSQGLDTIQGSALALNDAELAKLGTQGFVVSTRREFPTFLRGFAEIYSEHLPLYVSADAILESVHSSYDQILLAVERAVLIPDLRALLAGMHGRVAGSSASASVKADADFYIAVARGLLEGTVPATVAGADRARAMDLVQKAAAANGIESIELFGVERMEDFSQFKPRGHYNNEEMAPYFRSMMWLGRVDMRIVETLSDGKQVFRPDQYQAMLLFHELIGSDLERWRRIDDAVRAFVGESDSMVVPEVAKLVEDLGGLAAAKSAKEDAVVAALVAGGYGKQQIASHLMVNAGSVKTLPLNRSFLLFGQRYIVDSHVFSEVTYDRIGRMMPNPLDAAFAALGNSQALALESEELHKVSELPGALARMRVLIDGHDEKFWQANLYNSWMAALRALSPAADLVAANAEGLPEVAATEAWGRRVLGAQLGSWAELRHDTLLYAKQSYSGIPGCEFPDAYVDPYPELFDALVTYADQGAQIAQIAAQDTMYGIGPRVADYFDSLRNAASRLSEMANAQRMGQPFTAEQLAFINDAVRVDQQSAVCVTIEVPNGWYAKLFFNAEKSLEFDPTIADVHTQPADEAGNIVGKVLHVGTGYPRYMVATIDTCNGPRAYAGVVYAYHEEVTKDFARLTDQEWAARFQSGTADRPAEVPWMSPVLAQ